MNGTTMGLRISSRYLCAFKMPSIKCTCVRCPLHTPAHTITPPPPWATRIGLNTDLSPIRTVIVSQGDVSDFHHIQGVVGDLIAVRIQDVGVYLSPPPWKSPAELPTVFWQTPRSCGNLIAVRIHISEFTRRNRLKIQCLIPFWALPNTVTLYFGVIYILFLRTILHDCSTTATGSRKRRKAHKLSNGSLLWQQQVCNTILKCVL